jgi:diacylglycerol kinase family enzyme
MSVRANTFVIVNHSAARARAAWADVRRALGASGVAFDAHEAREFGDARQSARAALNAGYRTIAVVGGDGTLSEVVNGFFADEADPDLNDEGDANRDEGDAVYDDEGNANRGNEGDADRASLLSANSTGAALVSAGTALAILPGGTGNDFARALEGRRATLEHWIARLVAHARGERDSSETTRAVDVLRGTVDASRIACDASRIASDASRISSDASRVAAGAGAAHTFFCLNAVTLGVGAEVAARVAAQGRLARKFTGETRFALAAVATLARWRERRVRVTVDEGEPRELRTNLIAVVNSRYAGGGMMFSPAARVDDGLLDVVTASRLTRTVLAREMTRIHTGGHVANPRVSIMRGARVRIEPVNEGDALPVEADGDVRGHTPLELRVVPGALRVVI